MTSVGTGHAFLPSTAEVDAQRPVPMVVECVGPTPLPVAPPGLKSDADLDHRRLRRSLQRWATFRVETPPAKLVRRSASYTAP